MSFLLGLPIFRGYVKFQGVFIGEAGDFLAEMILFPSWGILVAPWWQSFLSYHNKNEMGYTKTELFLVVGHFGFDREVSCFLLMKKGPSDELVPVAVGSDNLIDTLHETNKALEIGHPKRKVVSEQPVFKGYVSFGGSVYVESFRHPILVGIWVSIFPPASGITVRVPPPQTRLQLAASICRRNRTWSTHTRHPWRCGNFPFIWLNFFPKQSG